MSATKASGAELVILQLSSLDQEEVYRNAEKKIVHAVIKNIPFAMELGFRGRFDPYVVDFHKFTLKCTLLYDTQGEERTVDWVKSSPIDCVVQVNETGERATTEVRLQALSSQHEDMAFRIKYTAVPPATSNLEPLVVVSEPIKVVSKQSQLKKNKKPPATRGAKKRTAAAVAAPENAQIADSLARIEAQQRQQQSLINSLIQTVAILQQTRQHTSASGASTPAVADVASSPNQPCDDDYDVQQPMRKRVKIEQEIDLRSPHPQPSPSSQEATLQFEHHLSGLMATFAQLPPAERATCIHRVFRDHSSRAGEVVEALLTESLTAAKPNDQQVHFDTSESATADLSNFDSSTYYDPNAYDLHHAVPDAAEGEYDFSPFLTIDNLSQHLFLD